jgi:hypothetical protein
MVIALIPLSTWARESFNDGFFNHTLFSTEDDVIIIDKLFIIEILNLDVSPNFIIRWNGEYVLNNSP